MRVGRWVGDGLAVFVLVGDGDAESEGTGVALAAWDGCEVSISAGITMSAPMTKNTAAIATLENCIGPPGDGGTLVRPVVDRPF